MKLDFESQMTVDGVFPPGFSPDMSLGDAVDLTGIISDGVVPITNNNIAIYNDVFDGHVTIGGVTLEIQDGDVVLVDNPSVGLQEDSFSLSFDVFNHVSGDLGGVNPVVGGVTMDYAPNVFSGTDLMQLMGVDGQVPLSLDYSHAFFDPSSNGLVSLQATQPTAPSVEVSSVPEPGGFAIAAGLLAASMALSRVFGRANRFSQKSADKTYSQPDLLTPELS